MTIWNKDPVARDSLSPLRQSTSEEPSPMHVTAYLNRIATAAPPHDVHEPFVGFARTLLGDNRRRGTFERMAERAQIEHRWSCLSPATDLGRGFYAAGRFPSTADRMRRFETESPALAQRAVEGLGPPGTLRGITHLITVTCTGLMAPGLDLEIVRRCGLPTSVERANIGFMGCQAGITALRLARHIVRSEPDAKVLLLNVELCTLHLQDTDALDRILSFLLFGDGCAAALVSAEPDGLALDGFSSLVAQDTGGLITWHVRDSGFDMFLSGRVPGAIRAAIRDGARQITGGPAADEFSHWAVHPGGRTILDAVQSGFGLAPAALEASRDILRRFGNMSSGTVLFVLKSVMEAAAAGERGCAMAFGPGLSVESLTFRRAA
jgi:predicted naringenin-chalcone synthase